MFSWYSISLLTPIIFPSHLPQGSPSQNGGPDGGRSNLNSSPCLTIHFFTFFHLQPEETSLMVTGPSTILSSKKSWLVLVWGLFFCLIAHCFVQFGCHLLDASSFLNRRQTDSRSWVEVRCVCEGGTERNGGRGNGGQDVFYEIRNYFQ